MHQIQEGLDTCKHLVDLLEDDEFQAVLDTIRGKFIKFFIYVYTLSEK